MRLLYTAFAALSLPGTNAARILKSHKAKYVANGSKQSKHPIKSAKSSKSFKSSKSLNSPKSAYYYKSAKYEKYPKSGKMKSSKSSKKHSCILPEIISAGQPVWVQTGQVMTGFEEALVPRNRLSFKAPKDDRNIKNNDQYMVQCDAKDYLADELCVVTCTDGTLDTTTYCGIEPKDVCKKARELTYMEQCPLDFDSDAPFYDGKSLKQWWQEVLDKYYFSGEAIWNRTSDIPLWLGHGSAFLEGYGVAVQHFPHAPAFEKSFDADAIEITGWVSDGYEYGPDTITSSKTLPKNGYLDLEVDILPLPPFNLPEINKPVNFPNPRLKTMSLLKDVYDPCDDSTYLGFPPECFLYHPAGYHVGNGKMLNWLSPLSNGEIDIGGVCTTLETIPPLIIPPLMANYDNVAEYIDISGGLIAVHPTSMTMHLCIDDNDIYHPRLCPWHTDDAGIDNTNGEQISVDARPFMPMPTEERYRQCAKRKANPGICDGPFDDVTYPYPWTQFL